LDSNSNNGLQKELIHQAIFNLIGTSKQKEQTSKTILISMIVLSMSVCVIIFGLSSVFSFESADDDNPLTSNYVIHNLKGDVVDTWLTWRILDGDLFHVHVVKNQFLTEEFLQAAFEVIMSDDSLDIDDSLLHKGPQGQSSKYYVGWRGALQSISEETFFPIPKNIHFNTTEKGDGDILIRLTNRASPDGYSGYTTSIVDEEDNQILKSTITIYDADKLSVEEFKTILRHELGHGFGLAHSTAPEDLMYPVIETNYPYVSDCDLDAIGSLYDGSQKSTVVCEK
jgi:hypothetical protein